MRFPRVLAIVFGIVLQHDSKSSERGDSGA